MNNRRQFIQTAAVLSTGLLLQPSGAFARGSNRLDSKRPPLADRKFTSKAVEDRIVQYKKLIADPEIAWLFENCFPNTLDTTVDFGIIDGKPDTYVITGDIDAMWLRDSTAQVWPYLSLCVGDPHLGELIRGVINRQVTCIRRDPYANAFYKDEHKVSEWKTDLTQMSPGVHERKWEIDSLCYPVRLAYRYWQLSGDTTPFDRAWEESIELIVRTFREQQRKTGPGPYSFQRTTAFATDTVPLGGYGYPVNPVGLICSMFRPSDDATIFPFLVPSNFFAVVSLQNAGALVKAARDNNRLANDCADLATEIDHALQQYATARHPQFGDLYAYEVNGLGSYNLMDDANVPSLLSLPYLGAKPLGDPVYGNTRRFVLSNSNPFFFKGAAAEGIGGPHAGIDRIWPLSILMRGMTSEDPAEIQKCLSMLKKANAGTGLMHESFHKNDVNDFTRKWFAWANTLFGEFILNIQQTHPAILQLASL